MFIDGLPVPEENRIGEEGKGFYYLLHGLNPERILVAVEAVGIARAAIRRATGYAGEREVFGRPIGQNQAIAHPPRAGPGREVEAANLMAYRAAELLRRGRGVRRGVERGQVSRGRGRLPRLRDGGDVPTEAWGYAKEYHVERYFREVMIARIAPVSREMILNYIAERVLGLPRSY